MHTNFYHENSENFSSFLLPIGIFSHETIIMIISTLSNSLLCDICKHFDDFQHNFFRNLVDILDSMNDGINASCVAFDPTGGHWRYGRIIDVQVYGIVMGFRKSG